MTSAVGLDGDRLRALLEGNEFVHGLEILDVCSSTNDEVRRRSLAGAPSGTVVLAEEQTAGRGRMGRAWFSKRGLGLYISTLIRPSVHVGPVTRWSVASALAACEACRKVADGVIIKWPNDLQHGELKLAGVLTELRSAGPRVEEVIVGAGFNVNHRFADFPPPLMKAATSLLQARGGRAVERELLATEYLGHLGERVAALERGDWEEVLDAWSRLAPAAEGVRVRVQPSGGRGRDISFEGITRGLDSSGALRVERDNGRVVTLHLGETVTSLEG